MKKYIKPEIEVQNIQLLSMIAASGKVGPEVFDEGTIHPKDADIKEMIGFDFDENDFMSDIPLF